MKSAEELVDFSKYLEQFERRQERDVGRSAEKKLAMIMDWDGFELSQHASPSGELFWRGDEDPTF